MARRTLTLLLAAPLLVGALAGTAASPASALSFGACAQSTAFTCATLPVPLDRSGHLAGTISLSVERKSAGPAPAQSAVVALAGGPGQPALPIGEFIAKAIAPALGTRDLLVFDQRGTGASNPLSCPALEAIAPGPAGAVLEQCALQIGPARGAYTTPESVADVEALRRAGGYAKLVLYGTSYGTKVALQYAERYPQNVEALVLDSTVPSDGPEALAVASFRAIAPALAQLCSARACASITRDPLQDMAALVGRLHKHALSGFAFDGAGRRSRVSLSEAGLLQILQAGDLNPALRALLPAAVHSALAHDASPLLRLHLLAEGLIPSIPRQPVESSQSIDEALFVATSCEEAPFPWQRSSPRSTREAEALAALRALPAGAFFPFDASTALASSLIPFCAWWPDASPPPPVPAPLPNVPTLILSGGQDLRTPTAVARQVAALIPDAQLLAVPFTGHSVLGSDFSGCAQTAVGAFFAGGAVAPCASSRDPFAPTPVAPRALGEVHAPPDLGGRPGRTLTAVLDTILDLNRQVIGATLQAEQELPSGSSFGGLRGGYARLAAAAVVLRGYSFVRGVQLSGSFPVKNGQLQAATIRISGSEASAGSVTFGAAKRVTGTLGGRRFNVSLARVRLSRSGGADAWPARPLQFPLPGLVRAGAPAGGRLP